MTPGQISQIIHTPEGYRIIKLISREWPGSGLFTDPRVQEQIRSEMFQGKQQMLRAAFYEVARSEAKITNYYAKAVLENRDNKRVANNDCQGWRERACGRLACFLTWLIYSRTYC